MADPKKGTGKKPKGSGRRLYTDENPRDTVRIKFATPADARATVAKVKNKSFLSNLSEETILKTNLNQKSVGDILNLEKSLKLGDEINGHLVYGHVDETCKLKSIEKLNGSNVLTFTLSSNTRKYLAPKCSISIDGISLTVNRVLKDNFNISIIPYTWENTSLKNSKIGDMFNIEIDMLARYVHRALKNEK